MDQIGPETSVSDTCGVFSSSPPMCSEYENHQNKDILLTNLNTNMFSTVDPLNTG